MSNYYEAAFKWRRQSTSSSERRTIWTIDEQGEYRNKKRFELDLISTFFQSSSSSSKQTSDSRLSTSSSNSSSTGFQSFFRWFKRNEKEDREAKKLKKKNCPTNNEPERIGDPQEAAESHSSQPQLSPRAATAKPRNDVGSSSSSSCDSVFSTATNGFAFISPVNYNPHGPGEIVRQSFVGKSSFNHLFLNLRRK